MTERQLQALAPYMDEELRERVHMDLAPCSPDEFWTAYSKLDPDFEPSTYLGA